MNINVIWPAWWKIINVPFIPLVNCFDRILILWGSRDSSKTDFTCKVLIYRCVYLPYFKCIMVRKVYNKVHGSQFEAIKKRIKDLGLEDLFHSTKSPYEIICKNGNKFVAGGMDDVSKIKGVDNPTHVWYEEDIPTHDDWMTITTSLRSTEAPFIQEIFTINPDFEGQFQENWFYKRFFGISHPCVNVNDKLSFRDSFTMEVEVDGKSHMMDVSYRSHHSNFNDNRWCPPDRKAFHMWASRDDDYYKRVYVDGLWTNKKVGGRFYKEFTESRQVLSVDYNPEKNLHLTWDFNVKPYVSLGIWQVYESRSENPDLWDKVRMLQGVKNLKKILVRVDEIAGRYPRNRTAYVSEDFTELYEKHQGAVLIYGDPSGKKEDTKLEHGENEFTIIKKNLKRFSPKTRLQKKAPNVSKRGEFINNLFKDNDYGIAIVYDPRCTEALNDYMFGKENSDGTKFKEKVRDPNTSDDVKIYYEKYHHMSDADDYFITKILNQEYKYYLRGDRTASSEPGEANIQFRRTRYNEDT